MGWREELVTAIENDAGVSALISDRIYKSKLGRETDLPAVFYRVEDNPKLDIKNTPNKNYRPIIDLEIFAETDDEAIAVAEALDDLLDDYSSTFITSIDFLNQVEDDFNEEDNVAQITQTYKLYVTRA